MTGAGLGKHPPLRATTVVPQPSIQTHQVILHSPCLRSARGERRRKGRPRHSRPIHKLFWWLSSSPSSLSSWSPCLQRHCRHYARVGSVTKKKETKAKKTTTKK